MQRMAGQRTMVSMGQSGWVRPNTKQIQIQKLWPMQVLIFNTYANADARNARSNTIISRSLNKTSNANTKTNANKYANTFAKAARSKTFDIKRPIWPSGNNGETGFTTSDVAICRQASGKKCSELISRVIVSKYFFQQYLINLDKEWIQLLQCLLSRLYADVIYNGL